MSSKAPLQTGPAGGTLSAERAVIQRIQDNAVLSRARGRIAPGRVVALSGVWGSAAPMLAAALAAAKGWPLVYLCPHLDDADDAADDIELLTGQAATLFPAWEADLQHDQVSDEIAAQRLAVCQAFARAGADGQGRPDVIVAPIMALLQPVPNPETLRSASLELRAGGSLSLDTLTAWLVDAGYESVEVVDQAGEFAHRGGIVDIWPPNAQQAVRVEFFGDEIESLRAFDLDTQRSTESLKRFELSATAAGREASPSKTTNLLSYLPERSIVCLSQPVEVAELANTFFSRLSDTTGLYKPEAIFRGLRRFATLELYPFNAPGGDRELDFGIDSLQRLTTRPEESLEELERLAGLAEVVVFCENVAEQTRFEQVLRDDHPGLAERLSTRLGHLTRGFQWPAEKLVLVGHHEVFHRYTHRRKLRRVRAGRPIDSFIDLQPGDYVVHVAHGIAQFEGLRSLEKDGRREEFLTLRFSENALLHVPVSQIGLVQKYIGSTRGHPKLSKLGGSAWSRQKDRAAEAVRDMAADMIRVQAIRESTAGVSYPEDTEWQRQFEQEFLYTETEDQLTSLGEIKEDLREARPMDRLLCGDVGYGKTELAMRAAFKVVQAGRQVAVLVPTTVLAAQHLRTFRERMADYPVTVEMVSRFSSAKQFEQVAKRLVLGQVDILIGTHRLLSEKLRFPDLGLVIIDEEQRFGVEHKERLKQMRATVDLLTLSATPIPRTLHMALLGLRDISSLTTPPLDRRSITTEVARYDEQRIRDAIVREMNRGGQVFFLHNRVYNIESMADTVNRLVPDARVAFAHGQMPSAQLERVMTNFVNQAYDVLVSTTIIESGLDIPTANTMIINDADRFGLAELHQLRGRVGRYKHRAYCYLMLPGTRSITPVAAKRLKAIEEFSDLGAGFQIAMRDLEIRGAGNILGSEQSGHIAAVGYELYCQLLEDAVRQERGEAPPPRRDVSVDLGISAYIPRNYVPADRQRMEVYRRIVRCATVPELRQLEDDLRDAYGKVPAAVRTLLAQAEVRVLAGAVGVESVVRMGPDIVLSIRDWHRAKRAFEGANGTVRMPDDRTVHWRLPPNYLDEPATLLTVLRKQLQGAVKRL